MSLEYSDADIEKLMRGIFKGDIDPRNLPDGLYEAVADHLTKALFDGWGKSLDDITYGSADYELVAELRENIYMFSGARTFQQTVEMSDALTDDDGKVRSFKEFKEKAKEIYTRYNGGEVDEEIRPGWIDAEYQTAVLQGYNAKKWRRIVQQKDTLPFVRRVAVGDEATCEICGELNGIVLKADDPKWEEIGGMAHFNCRCVEEQLDSEDGKDAEWTEEEVDDAAEASDMPEDFKFNPYFQREIFLSEGKGKHPYFSVPKEYRKFAESNFGLDIPEPDEN